MTAPDAEFQFAVQCDNLASALLQACVGLPMGVVAGAALGMLHTVATNVPPELRAGVTKQMRHAADLLDAGCPAHRTAAH